MDAKTVVVDPNSFRREDLLPAARALAAGGLVAFPTETVYGVAARRDDAAAVERLTRLRGHDREKPLTIHVATVEGALALVGDAPARVRPLIRRFWPGPLTIAFPCGEGREIFVRVPAHPIAQELLLAAGVAVLMSSENRSGEALLTSGAAAGSFFGDAVDWIVDGGETPIKDASTVVRVSQSGWECLREGIVSREMLARHLTTTVLFVCTGNSCRSPMAEALLRRKLARRVGVADEDLDRAGFRVRSAGTAASEGSPPSPGAVQTMQERAIDISRHRTRPVTLEFMERATVVIAMAPSHATSLADWWPEHRSKVVVIDEEGIVDPVGGPPDLYRECATEIERRLDDVVERLLRGDYAPEQARATS